MINLPKSIVFITGAFISSNCWQEWKNYFEAKGYKCLAPCWPYKDALPEDLRNRHPDTEIASNRLSELLDYFSIITNALEEKPILLGHSLGGLIVQLLLQRGFGSVGIAIQPFPPQGAGTSQFTFLKAWWNAIGLFTPDSESHLVSFRKWKNAITNGLTCEQQKQTYYSHAIPESKLIIRDAFKSITRINFRKPHPPLLFTSGREDKMLSPALVYNIYKKYTDEHSITVYKEFNNCNHLTFCSPTSMEVAEFILNWLQKLNISIDHL